MATWLVILSVVLVAVILIQIGRINELAVKIRGAEAAQRQVNERNARIGLLFMAGFLIFVVASFMVYKNRMLGYGPHESASNHGLAIDNLFNVTMIVTGIVFFITQFLLFWYAFKYRDREGVTAKYIPHDNRLEIVWMVVPSIVMTFLVIGGLNVWNKTMADIPEDAIAGQDFIEIEATGYQFAWALRFPGDDYAIGEKNYKLIQPGYNDLGMNFEDVKTHDDFLPDTLVVPVGMPIRARITSRDVLHNFYLPHFRVKMDAVPGMPTYFVFTPNKTTEQYRENLKEYPEWQAPADPTDPENTMQKWEAFEYELACAELCGNGHFSMRRVVRVVTQEEFEQWHQWHSSKSFYTTNIQGTDADPYFDASAPVEEAPIEEEETELSEESLSSL
ncbi:MAG: cytochrome c oxidase subunit II [Bacteroidota bacterium]